MVEGHRALGTGYLSGRAVWGERHRCDGRVWVGSRRCGGARSGGGGDGHARGVGCQPPRGTDRDRAMWGRGWLIRAKEGYRGRIRFNIE